MAETKDELPVAAYAVELPSGKFSRIRVDEGIAREYVERWNADHPRPPHAVLTPLTSHAAAQSRINALLEEVKAKEAAKLREWLDLIATGNHWKVEDEMRVILRDYDASLSSGRSGSGDGGMG